MLIPSEGLSHDAAYRLLSSVVVPRPIAWVTTLSPGGIVNLAPFSCFTFVSNVPPMLGISIGLRQGQLKDTARNIATSNEFVVNIVDDAQMQPVHESGKNHPPEVSEVEMLGLDLSPSSQVHAPRLAVAQVSMECRLHACLPFGQSGSTFYVGEVLCTYVRDEIHREGKVDAHLFRPLGRLGGPNYVGVETVMTVA